MISILEEKLKTLKRPSTRLAVLLQLGKLQCQLTPQSAILYAEEALVLSKQLNKTESIVESLEIIGYAHYFAGDSSKSILILEEAIARCTDGNQAQKARLYTKMKAPLHAQGKFIAALELLTKAAELQRVNNATADLGRTLVYMAQEYVELSDYRSALLYSKQALEIADALDQPELLFATTICIGEIYLSTEDLELALRQFETALTIIPSFTDNEYPKSIVLGQIGSIYQKQRRYDLALEYISKAIELQKRHEEPGAQAISVVQMATIYQEQQDLSLAYDMALEALQISCDSNYHYAVVLSHLTVGKILVADNRCQEAVGYLEKGYQLSAASPNSPEQCELLDYLCRCYKVLQRYEQALDYHEQLYKERQREFEHRMEQDFLLLKMHQTQEQYRLERMKLENDLELRNKEVAILGAQVMQESEFLLMLRTHASELSEKYPKFKQQITSILKPIEEKLGSRLTTSKFEESLADLHTAFQEQLQQRYPQLSKTERKICSFIKLGLTTKEIANVLYTSIRTVETHRLNIRKKIGTGNQQEIGEVLATIG